MRFHFVYFCENFTPHFMASLSNKIKKYWIKHRWQVSVIATAFVGIISGMIGFYKLDESIVLSDMTQTYPFSTRVYDTFRLFLLSYQFESEINLWLEVSRWCIFATFLLVSFRLFFTIIAPRFFLYKRISWFYCDHVVICGLNEITLELVKKYAQKKILIITSEKNQYIESLRQRGVKYVFGEPTDPDILKIAKINRASFLYAIDNDDEINLEIAQSVFTLLQKCKARKRTLLKCYTLVKDGELKNILEDAALFKYTVKADKEFFFDGILFNIHELGIHYSICKNIQLVLSDPTTPDPTILIIGLNDMTKNIILSLAHALTMNRSAFRFIIVEKCKGRIADFQEKYDFIQQFCEIQFHDEIPKQKVNSIFVCLDNQVDSIKKSIPIRHAINTYHPAIFVLCDRPENIHDILNMKGDQIHPIIERNIHLVNLFNTAFEYVVDLNEEVENMAEMAHNIWRKNANDEYKALSEHYKQSNRNQVLDNYLKTYLLTGKSFQALRSQHTEYPISDCDKETLAMMEHRRWMLEKYANGWKYQDQRDDHFKKHTDLKPWEQLSEGDKNKDYRAVELMMKMINEKI